MTTRGVTFSELDPPGAPLPKPSGRDVHLWAVDLDTGRAQVARLAKLLSNDERQRAERFHFDRDRRRFIVARGALRTLLGLQAQLSPSRVTFAYGPKGKPSLTHAPDLHFSLSHSSEQAVIALTFGGPVGVDIEQLREIEDAEDLARRFFSPQEVESFLSIAAERRGRAFFNCWTRKEAFVKALGEGLSLALDSFDVSLSPGEPARLLAIDGEPQKAQQWCLTRLDLGTDFAGTLATRWSPPTVAAWRLPPQSPGVG